MRDLLFNLMEGIVESNFAYWLMRRLRGRSRKEIILTIVKHYLDISNKNYIHNYSNDKMLNDLINGENHYAYPANSPHKITRDEVEKYLMLG